MLFHQYCCVETNTALGALMRSSRDTSSATSNTPYTNRSHEKRFGGKKHQPPIHAEPNAEQKSSAHVYILCVPRKTTCSCGIPGPRCRMPQTELATPFEQRSASRTRNKRGIEERSGGWGESYAQRIARNLRGISKTSRHPYTDILSRWHVVLHNSAAE